MFLRLILFHCLYVFVAYNFLCLRLHTKSVREAQLSQQDGATQRLLLETVLENVAGRQYFTDIMGLFSTTVT